MKTRFKEKICVLLLIFCIQIFDISGCSEQINIDSKSAHSSTKPIQKLIPSKPDGLKLLIFGIDAAEWDVIQPMVKEGKLPHIQKLIAEGTRGDLLSLEPTFSPIIWTTIATGKLPEKHGISGFTSVDPKTKELIPASSNQRKTSAFWNMYSLGKWIVGVIGWQASWPAEKVNGFDCSIYAYPPFFKTDINPLQNQSIHTTYPDSLRQEIDSFIISPEKLSDRVLEKQKLGVIKDEYQRKYIFARDWANRQISLYLIDKYKPNVFGVYFDGVDVLSHGYFPMYKWYRWVKYNEPTQVVVLPGTSIYFQVTDQPIQSKTVPGYTPEFEKYVMEHGLALEHYYEFMDDTLGEVLKRTDENTLIAIVSDHGFKLNFGGKMVKTGDEKYSQPTHWHKLLGVCILKGPGIKKNHIVNDASVTDILPTLLYLTGYPVAKDMDGKILWNIIDESYKQSNQLSWIDSYDKYWVQNKNPFESNKSPYDKDVLEQLRSLGYIQ